MSAREEMDRKCLKRAYKLCENRSIVTKYLDSISQKTAQTKMRYCSHICRFIDVLEQMFQEDFNDLDNFNLVKPMDIDRYMEYIRYDIDGNEKSASYRNVNLAAIKSFMKFLKKNGVIINNPAADIESPRDNTEHEIVTIDDDDLEVMKHNINDQYHKKFVNRDLAILRLGLTTGMRVSAIAGLDRKDIDFDEKCITVVEKGNIKRNIYVGQKTLDMIMEWLQDRFHMENIRDNDALFLNNKGTRISSESIRYIIKYASKGIDKHITPHKMRATCATKLYDATGDIYRVQKQLGHKSIENTKRYTKVSKQKQIESAEILDDLY